MKNIKVFDDKNDSGRNFSLLRRMGGALVLCLFLFSCSDYLDVVPENVETVDYAFRTRYRAEGFLYGIFSFLPQHANNGANPALTAGDEIWLVENIEGFSTSLWRIPQSEQSATTPLANYWAAVQNGNVLAGGTAMFTALRDCNIFLENIHLPFDLTEDERIRWTGEVLFMKAYFHFWLFRMYGPIPLIRDNLPIDAVGDESQPYREPVDEVVDYIVSLLDSAAVRLPVEIYDKGAELGRPTKAAALALKAQTLTLAASPLFNGNTDYATVKDKRNIDLFPQTYSEEKWRRAVVALKEAIDMAAEGGHRLYDFRITNAGLVTQMSEKNILAMQVRGAATDKWNEEIVWGDPNSGTGALQRGGMPKFNILHEGSWKGNYGPTQRMAEQFYTDNGVPIEEDRDWVGIDPMELKQSTADDRAYMRLGRTAGLFFNREARFYGAITFDGCTLFGNGKTVDNNLDIVNLKYGVIGGVTSTNLARFSVTGYLCKKMLNFKSTVPATADGFTEERYPFPIIRLADLFLMYAEALNESKAAPDAEVYEYIDLVRHRTGLRGVVESWRDHAIDPGKPLTKEGMRDIIHRERMNELAFEGVRFWDLRRWKLAEQYLNQPIRGLNIFGAGDDFYQITEIYSPQFGKKDYLWPIRRGNLAINTNLVQNYGW
ncbi:MAG: RagB/SusD family nutrient uptake outer membrane protein [Bacteroidales bacterium]|jgi:hypothetical protein|nr:RagB/SusD family nutrient uptake outer membrane protein [Bacteroidales bacterium]